MAPDGGSPRIPRPAMGLPPDPGLPRAGELLDPARLPVLLDPAAPPDAVRLRYLEYRPGRELRVHVEAISGGRRVDAMVVHDGSGVAVHRYPDDPGLPLLADPDRVAQLLGLPAGGSPRRLAWVPGRRAVLRVGDVVVKLYAEPGEARDAVRVLTAVAGRVPTARVLATALPHGAVAQTAVPGRAMARADALAAAAEAGALAADLHTVPADAVPGGLPEHGPAELLAQCAPVVALVRFARPDLAARVDALVDHLLATRPGPGERVVSHGDLTIGQFLRTPDGRLAVVDLDTLCLAPPDLDPACYAANLVSGRAGDVADARAALAAVRGRAPEGPGTDWYLAAAVVRRLDRAVRRAKRDWARRTEALLVAAEEFASFTGARHGAPPAGGGCRARTTRGR